MIDIIMDIIRLLNEGNVIPMQKDQNTKIDLYNDQVQLFVDSSGRRKQVLLFLLNFAIDDEQDNLAQIEDVVLNSDVYTVIGKPKPSNSYMILLWKVEQIDESLYPYIIQIEGKRILYKLKKTNSFIKNMLFYYTEKEQKCFSEWYGTLNIDKKPVLDTVLEALQSLNDESDQMQFLTRLLSKSSIF